MQSCNAGQKYLPPSIGDWGYYSFFIDSEKRLSIQVPGGGEEGKWTLYDVDTRLRREEEIVQLLTMSYDINLKNFEPYSLTVFLFGLAKRPINICCNLNELLSFEKNRLSHIVDLSTSVIKIKNQRFGYITYRADNGDYVGKYFLPFQNEYVIYFTIRINKEEVGNQLFVNDRLGMLRKIVETLEIADSK